MARFRSRGFRRRGSKPIHPTSWCGMAPIIHQSDIGGETQVRTICSSAEFEKFANPTIVRVRGSIRAMLIREDPDSNERINLAMGIRILDDQVITSGDLLTAAVQEGPWMWTDFALLRSHIQFAPLFNSSGVLVSYVGSSYSNADTSVHYNIDIRAMRKVPKNFKLALEWTWQQAVGTPELLIGARFRTLIKE